MNTAPLDILLPEHSTTVHVVEEPEGLLCNSSEPHICSLIATWRVYPCLEGNDFVYWCDGRHEQWLAWTHPDYPLTYECTECGEIIRRRHWKVEPL